MDEAPQMTIGEVASRAGIAASAIRYYESLGLLPEPERLHGQRRYEDDVIGRLTFIGTAQQAGLSLEQIKQMVADIDGGDGLSGPIRSASAAKLPEIEALIERANAMKSWLEAAGDCECVSAEECALFPAPSDTDETATGAIEVVRVSGAHCRRAGPAAARI